MQELVKSFPQSLIQNMNIPLIQEGFGQPFFANGCTSLHFLAGGSGSGRASDTWEPRAENSPGNFSWSNEIPGPASSLSGCRQWAKMNHQICRDSAVIYETRLGFSREFVGAEHPNLFKSQWDFCSSFSCTPLKSLVYLFEIFWRPQAALSLQTNLPTKIRKSQSFSCSRWKCVI